MLVAPYILLDSVPKKRSSTTNITQIQGPNGSYANVTLAFIFDAFTKYQFGTDKQQDLNLLYLTLQFDALDRNKPISIDPRVNTHLNILVNGLFSISRKD